MVSTFFFFCVFNLSPQPVTHKLEADVILAIAAETFIYTTHLCRNASKKEIKQAKTFQFSLKSIWMEVQVKKHNTVELFIQQNLQNVRKR